MNYALELREDTLRDEEQGQHTVYGFDVLDNREQILSFPDISFDREAVLNLMGLCHREQVALCHLSDVVRDFIVAQYLV